MHVRSLASSARAALALALLPLLPSCGGSVIVEDITCQAGLTACDGECVDTGADPENCGSCGFSCGGGSCDGGVCSTTPGCPPSLIECNGGCVDPAYDPAHCGGCNNTCASGVCDLGQCVTGECYCGALCQVVDIGSAVPQQAFASSSGFPEQWVPSCVAGSGPDVVFAFTAPLASVYSFDTFGSSSGAVLEVLDPGCGWFGCSDGGPDGGAYLEVELFAGQEVLVVVDTQGKQGSVQLNVAQLVIGGCATCSQVIQTGELGNGFCPGSEELYNELVGCICVEECAKVCEPVCNGEDFPPECEECLYDPVAGCGKDVDACLNDI